MTRRDALLGVVIALAWGLNFVAIGQGLHDLPPLLFVGVRYLFAAVPLVFLVKAPDVHGRTVVSLGLLGGVGQFGFLFLGVAAGMPAGMSSVILQAQMPFTVLLGVVLLQERPGRRQLAGLGAAVVGLALVAFWRGAGVPLTAVLLVVAAGACWAGANIVARGARSARPFSLLVHSSAVAAPVMLLLSLVFEGPGRDVDALQGLSLRALLSLAYVVVVATVAGYGAWFWLLNRYDSSVVAAFPLLAPVAALGSSWLVLGETVTPLQLVGTALVIAGVAVAVTCRPHAHRPEACVAPVETRSHLHRPHPTGLAS